MGYAKVSRTFVYGDFFLGRKSRSKPALPGTQPFAVEILREFSTTEFVGKLFYRAGGSWLQANGSMLHNHKWYTDYQKSLISPSRTSTLTPEKQAAMNYWSAETKKMKVHRGLSLEEEFQSPMATPRPKTLFFEMEGSGTWQVQNLRDESDDSGPYIAVALKFGAA